jgi:hypothetical protein
MYVMSTTAFIIGIAIGLAVFWRPISILMMLLVTIPYRSKKRFYILYDSVDDEESYSILGGNVAKNYSDYLRLHKAIKSEDHAYRRFRYHCKNNLKYLMLRIIPLALLPAVVLWVNWHWYLFGVLFAVFVLIFYKRFIYRMGIRFYQRAIILSIIDGFIRDVNKPRRIH